MYVLTVDISGTLKAYRLAAYADAMHAYRMAGKIKGAPFRSLARPDGTVILSAGGPTATDLALAELETA